MAQHTEGSQPEEAVTSGVRRHLFQAGVMSSLGWSVPHESQKGGTASVSQLENG